MEKFNLMNIWNSILETPDRPIQPRDRIYASEIGGAMVDRYRKLNGIAYTNPPNARSLRKFMAGNIWEFIVKLVIIMAGISYESQKRVRLELPDMLPVSGKCDFIIKGKFNIDNDKAKMLQDIIKQLFTENEEEDRALQFLMKVITALNDHYAGKEVAENVIEVKSVGSFVFEGILNQDNPKTHHMYQCAIYKECLDLPTDVIYVCRDDVRILQYNIDTIHPQLMEIVKKDIADITKYYKEKVEPPVEPLIIFENGKFAKNWKVEYSSYLSDLYKYKTEDGVEKNFTDPMEYYEHIQPIVGGINRVFKRLISGETLTDNNKKYIELAKSYGYDMIGLSKIHGKTNLEKD